MKRASRLAAPLSVLAVLAGCGTTPSSDDFDRRMATYVGRSEVDLVSGLGMPDRTYEADGRRLLAYERTTATTSPAFAPGLGVGFGVGSGGFGRGGGVGIGTGLGLGYGGYGTVPTATCSVTFELREGRVSSFDRRGEGCATATGF